MLLPGLLLQNRYRVVCQLGGGGFGKIFEVDDGNVPKVLKVLNIENFNNPEIKKKAVILFQREAQLLSQLHHPGIPRVEPDGYFTWLAESQEPLHCLVMEKIAGCNLQEWLDRQQQPLAQTQAIAWLNQIIQILEKLHQQQYFHRDIKPSNIMLKPDGQLVLIDFGAVREVTESYLQKQHGNETGTIIISAGYTPPEQAEGRAVPQSDFFALGRTMVCLLTKTSPLFLPKDAETGELIWRDRAPHISKPLFNLIDDLMAPFPGQRPQNSQAILECLAEQQDSVLSWQSLMRTLPGNSFLSNRRKPMRVKEVLRRARRVKFAFAGSLLLGGIGFWNLSPQMAIAFNNMGLANYKNGRRDYAMFYYKIALFLNSNSVEAHYNQGSIHEDRQQLDQARTAYQAAIKGGLDKAYNNLARLDILDKQYTKAVSLLQEGLQIATDDKSKYAMLKNLGWAQLELSDYQEARANLNAAIKLTSDRAPAYCLLAQVLERQKKPEAMLAWGNCVKYANAQNPDEKQWMRLAPVQLKAIKNQP